MVVNCEQVWREVSEYLEGDMDAGLRAAMDEHLRGCPRCRSVVEGTRNVIRLYGDEQMIEVPVGFGRRLERRLAQQARPAGRRWSTWNAWMVPVAALLLITGSVRLASSVAAHRPLKTAHGQPARDIPADMPVVVTAGAKVFHAAGCPFIHNKPTERVITAKEAMREGYIPCLRCMRKYLNTEVVGKAEKSAGAEENAYAAQDQYDEDDDDHGQ